MTADRPPPRPALFYIRSDGRGGSQGVAKFGDDDPVVVGLDRRVLVKLLREIAEALEREEAAP